MALSIWAHGTLHVGTGNGAHARYEWEKDTDAGLPVYPGNRTRAEWAAIAEESYRRAEYLPED